MAAWDGDRWRTRQGFVQLLASERPTGPRLPFVFTVTVPTWDLFLSDRELPTMCPCVTMWTEDSMLVLGDKYLACLW